MADWNSSFLTEPANSDDPAAGDDEMRTIKAAVEERAELEHFWDSADATTTAGGASGHGWHREGSAKGYYQAAAPTARPDPGATALDTNDEGRLWVDSDTRGLFVYSGSAWVAVIRAVYTWALNGTVAVGGDLKPQFIAPVACTVLSVYARLDTAPTDASFLMDVEKNGSNSIFNAAGDRITITTGNNEDEAATMHATHAALAAGDHLEFDIDQIGSTIAGADLTLSLVVALD